MQQDHVSATATDHDSNSEIIGRLTAIEDQGRQTLELMRSLISLLLPSAEQTGPTVQELMAAIVAMQRDTIAIARTTQADVTRLVDGLLPAEAPTSAGNGLVLTDRAAHS
jgi:hypothetical protein